MVCTGLDEAGLGDNKLVGCQATPRAQPMGRDASISKCFSLALNLP